MSQFKLGFIEKNRSVIEGGVSLFVALQLPNLRSAHRMQVENNASGPMRF